MERLGREIERELGRHGGGGSAVVSQIVAVWPEVVGDAVARNAWPLRVGRDGTLHVATTSSTWAFELDRLSPEIAERLERRLGTATPAAIRFRPGPMPEPARAVERAEPAPDHALPASPEVVAEAAQAAASIDDQELREMVERAARASLAKARSGRAI
ncbi:MAG TPA: DUF721 domain-containing protein [Gaiellaceae bacterium]|nr:DUF721 domain-containing protein [Gaiellaceae bacterium]